MKKIILFCFVCCASFFVNAQCSISPFIQQNYELDAKILVLREIQYNVNDPDYDNPFITQSRVDHHLEKLSAMYQNPDNNPSIDSLFNEFQFHTNVFFTQYREMTFRVNTSVSWVQTLKDTGQSGVASLDDFFTQYQFSVTMFADENVGVNAGKTKFIITTNYDFINTYALVDDLSDTVPSVIEVHTSNTSTVSPCNYTGIPYQIPDYDLLVPVYHYVSRCDILKPSTINNGAYVFYLSAYCLSSSVNQSRYVTVSDDCSQVTFSRTLSTEDIEISNVAIYPNPASYILNIQGVVNIQQVEIYSVLGRTIEIPLDVSSSTLNVSSLKNGVYFLKVTDDQNRSAIRKFIKK